MPRHAARAELRAHVEVGTGAQREHLDQAESVGAGQRREEGERLDRSLLERLGDRLRAGAVVGDDDAAVVEPALVHVEDERLVGGHRRGPTVSSESSASRNAGCEGG